MSVLFTYHNLTILLKACNSIFYEIAHAIPLQFIHICFFFNLLGYKASWLIKSNTESGTGYSDILVEVPNNRTGIVIELK